MNFKAVKWKERSFTYGYHYIIVDLDVSPEEEEITLGGRYEDGFIGQVCLKGVMKQFPQVKKIVLEENLYKVQIDNFMFPNVEMVESKSSEFGTGKYLVKNEMYGKDKALLNTFCREEDVLDLKGISSIADYALAGYRLNAVANANLTDNSLLTPNTISGCLIAPADPETGILSFGDYIFSVDESAEDIRIPDTVKGFVSGIRFGKKVTVEGPNALEKLAHAIPWRGPHALEEVHLKITDSANASKYAELCRKRFPYAKKITVSENPFLTAVDGILYTKDMKTLICCPYAREGDLVIPEGVECILHDAFCRAKISSVTFPDSLREIGDSAFIGCENLSSVSFGKGITEINGTDAFCQCPKLTELIFPPQLRKIGKRAFRYCTELEKVVLNDGLEEIGEEAFAGYFGSLSPIKEISIPGSVRKLGKMTFPNIERIYLHGSFPEGLIQAVAQETKPSTSIKEWEITPIECILDSGRRIYIPRMIDSSAFITVNLQYDLFGDSDHCLDFLYENTSIPDVKQMCAFKSYKESGRAETGQYLRRSAKNVCKLLLKDKNETDLIEFVKLGLASTGIQKKILEEAKKENMVTLTAYLLQAQSKKSGGKFRL